MLNISNHVMGLEVLNLIINGLPSILREMTSEERIASGF